ncbi:MAG: YmdB family metallophosphoesterase [Acidobacteria bacterium]|nr:YmdB family metallophosphoesterase [Acidobacteriota bacterium]MCB9398679.1 YmdB family metallophosphoesterase [Acidobacteriota bacterium]
MDLEHIKEPLENQVRLLAIGDIIGRPGRQWIKKNLSSLRQKLKVDLCIANIENASGGFGITEDSYKELLDAGIDAMTSGNHHYDQRGEKTWMDHADRMVRPLNFAPGGPGQTELRLSGHLELPICLLNVMGRTFMKPYDCPFRALEPHFDQAGKTNFYLLDVHAETTSEKMALGFWVAGRFSAVWGTHTHVPTADARILDEYTGYLTDLGMTGPYDSVIGMRKESVLQSFLTLEKARFEVASGDVRLGGCVYDLDRQTGQCTFVKPLWLSEQDFN